MHARYAVAISLAGLALAALSWLEEGAWRAPSSLGADSVAPVPAGSDPVAVGVRPVPAHGTDRADCSSLSPFLPMPEACQPGIPSPEVAAQDRAADEATVVRSYSSSVATAVLTMQSGAAPAAFKKFRACAQGTGPSEAAEKECIEIAMVMPYALLTLRIDADEGDREAALLLAENYLLRSAGASPDVRPQFLATFDKYLALAKNSYPHEAQALLEQAEQLRISEGKPS